MIKRFAMMLAAAGALWLGLATDAAWADRRVALVIGNSAYQAVNRLPNPSRDADAMAKMFREAGFDSVDTLMDVGNLEFKRGIRRFEDTATDADIAVIFYAGHGIEIGGTNYLIPVDARLASDRDAQDEAITLDRLVSSADSAKKLRVVILDACRDNPFAGKMRRDSRAAQRGIQSGLTRVDPSTTDTLIAYAAKAGSTAEDGDAEHSPFTTALLKDLTVPGRDIRLAFGYVKDDVMKATNGRQEPFVYGSLGGGIYSLVPPLPETQQPSISDAKADYELVAKIGSRKAWEVYLSTYKTGFYADLARAQLAALPPDVQLASLSPAAPAPQSRQPTTKEALDWDRVKDTTDQATLQTFIKRYPDSPLAIAAQNRLNVLMQAQKEREEQARLAKEAAERKAAELAAQKQREDEERRARAAEAAQKAKAEEAARQAAEAKRKAELAEQQAAEAKRKAEEAAARQAAEAQRKAEEQARIVAAAEAAKARQESEKAARAAEAERQKAADAAALEATCKQQGDQLAALQAKGSAGSGVEDMAKFVNTVTCDRIKPQAMAALNTFNAEAAKRAADLVKSAQTELTRIGCYTGDATGTMSDATRSALSRYLSAKGQPTNDVTVTDDLVAALQKQQPITCLRTCPTGQSLSGDSCVANAKPAAAPPAPKTANRKPDDSERKPPRAPAREREQATARPPVPRATQQAAVPRISGGGYGGGGHAPMVGVGF